MGSLIPGLDKATLLLPRVSRVLRGEDLDTLPLSSCHQENINACLNMCRYLRLCDNNCPVPLKSFGAEEILDCGDCRKRKEHEDFEDNECKFSKQSEEDSVSFLVRKWASTETDVQRLSQSPILDKKSSETPTSQTFSWMHRTRNDSLKENETLEENNNFSAVSEAMVVKGRFMISECDQMSLSEKHRATVPIKPSKNKSKTKQLSKKLSVLQSKIESEAEVIQLRMGYRPSHADKMKCEEISDLVQEQEKIKLELKDLNEESPRKKSIDRVLEKERDRIVQSLAVMRLSVGRPYELDRMTAEEIVDERRDMQSLLNEFEKKYSVPLSKRDKDTMSGLYERYRCVRRMSRRQSNELVPIPEHTSIDLTLASPRPRLSSSSSLTPGDFDACTEEELQPVPSPSIAKMSRSACVNVNDAKWHTLSFCELRDTLGKLKESKKSVQTQDQ